MPTAALSSPDGLARWAEEQGVGRADLLAALLVAALAAQGIEAPGSPLLRLAGTTPVAPGDLPIVADAITPDLLGEVLGATAPAAVRAAAGAVFTPRATAEGLVRAAVAAAGGEGDGPGDGRVLDPSVGGGAFSLALVRALVSRGATVRDAISRLEGSDTDPLAVAVTRAALGLWAVGQGGRWVEADGVQEGDFLLPSGPAAGPVQVVVGNPPFQSQLRGSGVRSPERLTALRRRFGAAVGPYTDTAALFLLAALDRVAPHGSVVLVQPRSFLGAEGAAEVRRRVLDQGAVVGLWEPATRIFDAAVDVCALVVVAGAAQPAQVSIWSDERLERPRTRKDAAHVLPAEGRQGRAVVVSARGAPPPPMTLGGTGGCLGDRAAATAGFRDQFYGMAPCVEEAVGAEDRRPRLVTSGLIDPGACGWGLRPARFAGQRWQAPVLAVDDLDPSTRVGRWVRARLVPKIVVASQTKVIEAVLDEDGALVPSPPCISVEAPGEQLPLLLAALLSPPATVWLHGRAAGTGLAPGALRVSVRDLVELPLPVDRAVWEAGAGLLAGRLGDDAASHRFGRQMAAAYGLDPDTAEAVVRWWADRLPAA
jgi:hypothetical protein